MTVHEWIGLAMIVVGMADVALFGYGLVAALLDGRRRCAALSLIMVLAGTGLIVLGAENLWR